MQEGINVNISQEDLDLLRQVDALLKKGHSLIQIASMLGVNHNTLYSRIQSAGYKVQRISSLVPLSAPALENVDAVSE